MVLVLLSCNEAPKEKEFDYGHIDKNKYLNSYFDFEITIPEGWVVQNKEQMDEISNTGKKLLSGDDENMEALLNASDVNTANLLAVFQYELGTPVDYNPGFMIIAENIKNFPGIKTGEDYFKHMKKVMEMSQMKFSYVDKKFETEIINGTEFYKMNAEINYLQTNIKQIYFSTIKNGFSLGVVISFINDEQKTELLKAVNTMVFKQNQ